MARGRDVSLRYEGGHSPENHTEVSEWCWKPPTDRSGNESSKKTRKTNQSSSSAEHVVVNYTTNEPEHLPRASDHEGRTAEQWYWGCRRGIQGRCNLPQSVSAKKPVVREKYRPSHSQGASGENPRLNHSRRASGEKKIKEKHGYEDSEKNIEATMRSQSSAQRREGRNDEKNREEPSRQQQAREEHSQVEEQSQQQAREEHSQQQAEERCDRDKAKYEDNYEEKHTTEEKLQSASPEASKNRCKCPAGAAGAKELKLDEGIAKIPEINFNVEYKRIIQAAQQLKTATTSRKTPQRQHEDCMTKYNEVHLD